MKTSQRKNRSIYLAWFFSGMISFVITFPFCCTISLPTISAFGESIEAVISTEMEIRVTEEHLLSISMFMFIPFYGIVLGVLQHLILREKLAKTGWWILITAFGWLLVWFGLVLLISSADISIFLHSNQYVFAATAACLGILIGLAQWLILRTQVTYAEWWILANALGFGIAGLMLKNLTTGFFGIVMVFAVPHIITGIILWLLLDVLPQEEYSKI